MRKSSAVVWVFSIVLAFIVDQLFWDRIVGLNYFLLLLILIPGLTCFIAWNGYRPARSSLWLWLPLLGFASITLFRQEPLTRGLAFVFSLIAALTFVFTYSSGRWPAYILADYLGRACQLFFYSLAQPVEYIRSTRASNQSSGRQSFPFRPILFGVLLALPVLAVFTSLLSSADPVFEQMVADLLNLIEPDQIQEYLLRAGLIWLMAYGLIGIALYMISRSSDEKMFGMDKPLIQPLIGFIETAIVLGSLIILFGAFVLIQFKYFFGGIQNIGVAGFTYSQYARRGFSEMIWVAFITLLVLIGLNALSIRQGSIQRRVYSGLCLAMTAEVIVILIAAFRRTSLAIDWHGLSRLRIYPQIFLVWLGLVLVAVAVLEVLGRTRYITLAGLICSMGFGVSLAVFNVDAAIVHYNVDRIARGSHINYPHLASLSIDAVPALVEEFQNPALSAADHQSIGAVLVCHTHQDDTLMAENVFWQVFTFSRYSAAQDLQPIREELAGYTYNTRNGQPRVKMPDNRVVSCLDNLQ